MDELTEDEYNLDEIDDLFTRSIERIKELNEKVDKARSKATEGAIQEDLMWIYLGLGEIIFRLMWLRSRIPRISVKEQA